jgi:Raf kinase inhibitor-like YbhB/YbcL family protein
MMAHRFWLRSSVLLCTLSLALTGVACGEDVATSPTGDVSASTTDVSAAPVEVDAAVREDDVSVEPEPEDVSASGDAAPPAPDTSLAEDTSVPEDDASAVTDVIESPEDTTDVEGGAPPGDTLEAPFTLASADFTDGGAMPEAFACCQGSPSLSWSGVPEGTVSFALIYDDPDAGDFDHWAVYNIPADVAEIAAGSSGKGITAALPEGATELNNGFGFPGYLGSCPPTNHTYRWRLWALNGTVDSAPASFAGLEAAASALSLGVAQISQTFGPKTPEQGATCD